MMWRIWSKPNEASTRPVLLELRSSKAFIIFVVAFATFTDILLYGLIVPVVPTALHERVGLSVDEEQSWVSILLALYGAALLAAAPLSGYLADRIESRRWPLLMGLVALGGATALLCVGTNLGLWIAGRLCQGASAAVVWTVGLALIVDTVERDNIGQAMGYAALAMTIGTLAGPLLGGVIYENGGYYAVFALAFAIIAVDIFLRVILIERKHAVRWLESDKPSSNIEEKKGTVPVLESALPSSSAGESDSENRHYDHSGDLTLETEAGSEVTATPDSNDHTERADPVPLKKRTGALLTLLSSERMILALWIYFVISISLTSLDSVLPLFVQETFHWKQAAQGLIFIPLSVPSILGPLFGILNDRYEKARRYTVAGSLLATLPFFVLLRLVTENSIGHKVLLCALLTLIGISISVMVAPILVEASYVIQEKEAKSPDVFGKGGATALSYGLVNSAFAAGTIAGPFLAGFIRQNAGWGTMSWVLGLMTGVSAIPVFLLLGGRIWEKQEPHVRGQSVEETAV